MKLLTRSLLLSLTLLPQTALGQTKTPPAAPQTPPAAPGQPTLDPPAPGSTPVSPPVPAGAQPTPHAQPAPYPQQPPQPAPYPQQPPQPAPYPQQPPQPGQPAPGYGPPTWGPPGGQPPPYYGPPPSYPPPGYGAPVMCPEGTEPRTAGNQTICVRFREEKKVRTGLIIGGSVMLGVGYGLAISIAAANDFNDVTGWLAVPVAGPFITMGAHDYGACGSDTGCALVGLGDFFVTLGLVLNGLVQVGGATMVIVGATVPTTERVPDVAVGPRAIGTGYGLGLDLAF